MRSNWDDPDHDALGDVEDYVRERYATPRFIPSNPAPAHFFVLAQDGSRSERVRWRVARYRRKLLRIFVCSIRTHDWKRTKLDAIAMCGRCGSAMINGRIWR